MSETKASADATVHFDGARCIHSRHCVLTRPDVFVPNVDGEWIHPERATADDLVHLARNCPSGAIQVTRADGRTDPPPLVNLVRVLENGPLAVTADLQVGDGAPERRATLCRCGHSANKPYCDGSHQAAGFTATGEPPVVESQALAARGGALRITPAPNGPLLVDGNLEVVSGTGHTINRCVKTALCRCGQSSNKPYCDGTHRKVGFTAP